MTNLIDLLDDLMAQADERSNAPVCSYQANEPHVCDGCGESKTDVDLWASNYDTPEPEEIYLCLECGS